MSTPAINLHDYEALARERLNPQVWAYFSGGAGDEHTARDNEAAWARLKLLPRVLRPMAGGHTRCELLGRAWPHPVLLAPAAHLRMAHTGGESAAALAAAMQGAGLVLSCSASTPLEAIAQLVLAEATRGPLWFQLYLQHDRGFTAELVRRAETAGYEALVLTVDAATSGARDRQRRAGFTLPQGIKTPNLAGLPPPPAPPHAGASLFDQLMPPAPTWDDVAWLRSITRLPILLKGVLHEGDARQAAALGVAGLIVSNHGGRVLDTAVATADALPRIAQSVGSELAVLADGGVRRGTDVLKALALGARAVLIGRPYVYALAAAGAQGVAHVIRLLRDELEIAMVLTGCRTLADIGPELLRRE
jgi:4-hydroxymandelate oxidase